MVEPDEQPPAGSSGRRILHHEGREWVVRDGGRALTGHGHLRPARLRLIQFAHADAPDIPVMEVIAPPGPVEALHDSELIELLGRARDVPEYSAPDESSRSGRRIRSGGPRGRERRPGGR
ncbi:MAG TPA: hypothetical protein VMM79_14415 [Longimicrobiales bacterium]|nr:hypothetical protein [Longimicrobiales bacterium]